MTRQALTLLPESEDAQDVAADIDTVLIRIYQKQGQTERVLQLLRKAIGTSPAAMELRYLLGTTLLDEGPSMQLEEAAATLLLVCNKMPFDDAAYQYYGLAMAKRGRLKITYLSLQEAVRLNPNNTAAQKALAQLSREIGDQALDSQAYRILLDEYPSHAPRKLVQVRRDAGGRDVPDGIEAEWYENGRLKRFLDVDNGLPNGFEITWTPDGRLLSRVAYRNGRPLDKQGE
jgi:tetratricopeptide (TPR) repeat protein